MEPSGSGPAQSNFEQYNPCSSDLLAGFPVPSLSCSSTDHWAKLLFSSPYGIGLEKSRQEGQATPREMTVMESKTESGSDNGCSGGGNDNGTGMGVGRTKKARKPRFEFQTKSAHDILDDGYRWRKYGQKAVKNSHYPRSYYRCTQHTCNVKKQVQRLSKDTSIVVTTYEGVHNHPCEKMMETLSPLLRHIQFLSQF